MPQGPGDNIPLTEKELSKLIRKLAELLTQDDVEAFKQHLSGAASTAVITAIRTQKLLTKGSATTRTAAASIVTAHAGSLLPPEDASEFALYAKLSIEISLLREQLKISLAEQCRLMPRLSIRQLVAVAERTFTRSVNRAGSIYPSPGPHEAVSENERRIHDLSGHANDVMFAVLRALNEGSHGLQSRELKRPDAITKSLIPFKKMTMLSGLLNSLDYLYDSASYNEFRVSSYDEDEQRFRLDHSDFRLTLIRQLTIRRRLIHAITGLRNARFVRERLRDAQGATLGNAITRYCFRSNAPRPNESEHSEMEKRSEALLRQIDAEDDLLMVASGQGPRAAMLYHMSMALRWSSMAGAAIASKLPGEARRKFADEILLEDLLQDFVSPEESTAAQAAWSDLTIELPASGHFDVLRRPFVRTKPGVVRPIREAGLGMWAAVVRETLIKGGDVGRRYGAVWEEFYAKGFTDTDWTVIGSNIDIVHQGKRLTEIDLLLLRDDLLLVVEIKALTGSGLSPYDHWKNRLVIEKGCRQTLLAADHLRDNPKLLASISNRATAERVRHIQPLVLTNEAMFDGWSHLDVPVAGETIRKAITEGTKVETYDGDTLEVISTQHHLRREDLTTDRILKALRDPIELRIAPEQGAVQHVTLEIGKLKFLIPAPASGPA